MTTNPMGKGHGSINLKRPTRLGTQPPVRALINSDASLISEKTTGTANVLRKSETGLERGKGSLQGTSQVLLCVYVTAILRVVSSR